MAINLFCIVMSREVVGVGTRGACLKVLKALPPMRLVGPKDDITRAEKLDLSDLRGGNHRYEGCGGEDVDYDFEKEAAYNRQAVAAYEAQGKPKASPHRLLGHA